MKKKLCILVILIAVLLVGTVGCYFMPKKFGKNVNPSEVDHIKMCIRDRYHVEPIELTKKRQRNILLVQHLLGWARYLF